MLNAEPNLGFLNADCNLNSGFHTMQSRYDFRHTKNLQSFFKFYRSPSMVPHHGAPLFGPPGSGSVIIPTDPDPNFP